MECALDGGQFRTRREDRSSIVVSSSRRPRRVKLAELCQAEPGLLVAGGANFDFARGLPAQTEVTVAGVQWGGVITHSVGDQILALFGYPTNHEEDAERAVHAGLDLVARIGELLFLSGEPLQVRIAIATGLDSSLKDV